MLCLDCFNCWKSDLYREVMDFDRQVQEWPEFGMIDEEEIDNFNLKEKKRAGAKLPIDTAILVMLNALF